MLLGTRRLPDCAKRERIADMRRIAGNMHIFWSFVRQAYAEFGQGAIIADTTVRACAGIGVAGPVAFGDITAALRLSMKSAATAAGLNPNQFAGHSLRSGFITEATCACVESRDIIAQTGHKSETVMRGYLQDTGLGASAAVKADISKE